MYQIVEKRQLNDTVVLMKVAAPFIAKKAMPGQFIIFRVNEKGERIPLTIADYDREAGTITIIFQVVGRGTQELAALNYNTSSFEDGAEFVAPAHLYSFDLDVFGPHSLFQYINRTCTQLGKNLLATWLGTHLEKKTDIEARQEYR